MNKDRKEDIGIKKMSKKRKSKTNAKTFNKVDINRKKKRQCCCNYFCNKRGLFTEIDMAFSNYMQLVPNNGTACRCCNKLFSPPIFQGRSCNCLSAYNYSSS